MAETVSDELEAVNFMLRKAGERPVSSLSFTAVTKASIALTTLRDTSKTIQGKGWTFNTEDGFPLTPDASTKEIAIPANTLKLDPSDQTQDYVNRGSRLYDRINHTFQFEAKVVVNIVFCLPWDELPQAAREYIKIKAARAFLRETIGAPDQINMTEEEELQAFVALMDAEAEADTPNLIKNVPGMRRNFYTNRF